MTARSIQQNLKKKKDHLAIKITVLINTLIFVVLAASKGIMGAVRTYGFVLFLAIFWSVIAYGVIRITLDLIDKNVTGTEKLSIIKRLIMAIFIFGLLMIPFFVIAHIASGL